MTIESRYADSKADHRREDTLSLEGFRFQYAKRVFELLGRDEKRAASALGLGNGEFKEIARLCPE